MFEISRDTILTTERHAEFLRKPSLLMPDAFLDKHVYNQRTEELIVRWAKKARDFVANPENKALGLAAPQVGSKYAWFVMNFVDGSTRIIFNPIITGRLGNKKHGEGCFSEPDCDERTKRSREITVQFWELQNEGPTEYFEYEITMNLEGRDAQVFQHEYDHLKGILIADKKKKKTKQRGWF